MPNVRYVGFKKGNELASLIREAAFSVCPSQWYENCPFSVMESQSLGTPVIGTRIGGIPELIEDRVNGRLFERKNSCELASIIQELWNAPEVWNSIEMNAVNSIGMILKRTVVNF